MFNPIQHLSQNKKIHIVVLAMSILFVILSGIFIAHKTSIIHSYNHDQLVDSYMFNSYEDFKHASFPASHTFFIKWPLFALSGVVGNTNNTFTILTIALYLITALGVITLIVIICRRRLLLAALCITIYGLVLLMMPAQSSPGVLAPVNMAMITTRNVEYLFYILFLFFLSRTTRLFSPQALLSVTTITLLGLTDKLFLLMALVAAAINILYQVVFMKIKNRSLILNKAIYPLVYIVVGYILTIGLSVLIDLTHITNIHEPVSSAPFNFVASVSQAFTAAEWALQATMVNLGVNPFGSSIGIKILPYVINGFVLILAIYVSIKLYVTNAKKEIKNNLNNGAYDIGYWLFISTVASFAIYTFSNHYLENDLRYMGIATFSAILSIAIYFSRHNLSKISNSMILAATLTLLALSPVFLLTARSNFNRDLDATKSIFESRFENISNSIKKYDVKVFIAEYWNTSPIRYRLGNTIQTSPLMSTPCISKNYFLTSFDWYTVKDINDRSALHIVKGKSITSDTCLEELAKTLGRPEHQIPLNTEGSEELWIYNHDIRGELKW